MDPKVEIKEEPVWHEEAANTAVENFEFVSEMVPLKQEIKSELLEPTQEITFQPSSDIKEEILVEQDKVDLLVPYIKEEKKVENVSVPTGEKVHRCSECNLMFSQEYNLKEQICTHSEERSCVCDTCSRMHRRVYTSKKYTLLFEENYSLLHSTDIHSTDIPSLCKESCSAFIRPSKQTNHRVGHTEGRLFHCKECKSTFIYKSNLNKHMLIHTEPRKFKCKECNEVFTQRSNLEAHMVIHTGKRPYCCKECNCTFNYKSNLFKHMIIHTGHRLFKCEQCSKAFAHRSGLQDHILTHTRERCHRCSYCSKTFIHKRSLLKHLRSHTV